MSSNRFIVAGLAVVGAFAIGRFVAPDPAPAPAPPATASPAPARAGFVAPMPSRTTVVREIVREVDREPPTATEEEAAPEELERRATALDRARTIIDGAVRAGRWTRDDAKTLAEIMPTLDREGASEVMTALIGPINAGRLTLETSGLLFDPT